MRFAILLICVLLAPAHAAAETIGVFTSVSGEVNILRGLNMLAAAEGVEVNDSDVVETGKDASAQLDMEDGSVLKLGPQTRIELAAYELDSDRNVVSATVEVLSGWLRFAVSKLKPQGRYNLSTPVLNIGVRGTEGTIEARNDQGGLHLEEGLVEVTPLGADVSAFQTVQVRSGEFIQRIRGRSLAKLPTPPAAFKQRLPKQMRDKLLRRAHELKQRGVPPRVIRSLTRKDAERYIERHPHIKERLEQRFEPLKDDAVPNNGKAPEAAPAPGIGGKVLRDRALKGGTPGADVRGKGMSPATGEKDRLKPAQPLPESRMLLRRPAQSDDAQAPKVMPQLRVPLKKSSGEEGAVEEETPKKLEAPTTLDNALPRTRKDEAPPPEQPQLLRPPAIDRQMKK